MKLPNFKSFETAEDLFGTKLMIIVDQAQKVKRMSFGRISWPT